MSYIVNKSVNSEARQRNFIDVGIHDNVKITNIELKLSPNNNWFLTITFEKDGKTLIHTEFEPKDRNGNILENKQLNQIKRLKHIATKFMPEEEFEFETPDFKSFCEQFIKRMKGKYENKLSRVKVVYANNNYTSLPSYVPFIEPMDTPKEKTTLEMTSIDKLTRDNPDKNVGTPNPYNLDLTPTSELQPLPENENELPF